MCFTFDNVYLYFNPRGCEGFDPALKHDDVRIKAKSRFGPIQNYMALKPRNRFYPLPLALQTLVLNRTLVS